MVSVILFVIAVVATAAPIEITPCDFNAGRHEGELVKVSAKILFTKHGVFLIADHCSSKGQHAAALMYPGDKGIPKVSYDLDPQALIQLRPFYRTNCGRAIACGVLLGEVVYKSRFRLKRSHGDVTRNGFGAGN